MPEKPGRPKRIRNHQPPPLEVIIEEAAKIQCTYEEIAAITKLAPGTIKNKYGKIITQAKKASLQSLRRAQWKVAVEKEDVKMLIWLGKQYLGQSEKFAIGNDDDQGFKFVSE